MKSTISKGVSLSSVRLSYHLHYGRCRQWERVIKRMIRYGVILVVALSSVWCGVIPSELVRRAIEGDGNSLYALGAKYANGRCLDRNDTIAYALWESVSTPADGNLTAYVQTQKYKLANRMSAKEINEGQKLSQDKERVGEILKSLLSKLSQKEDKATLK